MELLIISENKIKISLTKNDLDTYDISCENIDYDTTETRRVVWSLLDDVKRQSGFDAAKSRIFVQIYPSIDGGCEMYVSRLGKEEREKSYKPQNDKSEARRKKNCYIFSGMNELIAVCRAMLKRGYSGRADLYADETGGFYLCAEPSEQIGFITEFGASEGKESTELYIKEHCREICVGDAVSTLGRL